MKSVCAVILLVSASAVRAELPKSHDVLRPLPAGSVLARGWMATLAERCCKGLGGNFGSFDPDQFEKPYATRDYDAHLNPQAPDQEIPGWCAEMAGQYRLGQVELSLVTGNEAIRADFRRWLKAAMDLQDKEPDGYFGAYRPGDDRLQGYNPWGAHFALKALRLEYEATGDRRVFEALRRGVRWFSDVWFERMKAKDGWWWNGDAVVSALYVGPTIIETACDVYALTGDEKLLAFARAFAEQADAQGNWSPADCGCRGGFTRMSLEQDSCHVVAYETKAEAMAALASATGDGDLRKAAVALLDDYRSRVGWQITGAPRSKMEHTGFPKARGETEYCAFVCGLEWLQRLASLTGEARFGDLLERLVFNGAMGARKKDERAIAYCSSPNQTEATSTSAFESWLGYYTAYTPCLFAACCPAQSIRLIPAYLHGAVMRAGDDLAVVAYGPYSVSTKAGGVPVRLTSETAYPFEGRIGLAVAADGWKGNLRLRRPSWATSVELSRNGRPVEAATEENWISLKGPWKADERVDVRFGMEAKVVPSPEDGCAEPMRAVERGPLVYALRIPEKWTQTDPVPPSKPLPKGWHWHEARPAATPVAYEMPVETAFGRKDLRVVATGEAGYPWENPPVKIVLPLRRKGVAQDEPVELVPFGATTLRQTSFALTR